MTSTHYDPDVPKTAEELELEDVVRRLAYRLLDAPEDSAEYKMIMRQMEGIRHGSELGGLLMQEYASSSAPLGRPTANRLDAVTLAGNPLGPPSPSFDLAARSAA